MLLAAFAAYLLRCHYIKAYSDPCGWIGMAERLFYAGEVDRWSTVFAMYLIIPLKLFGPHYVYLSNLPWIVFLVFCIAAIVRLSCASAGDDAQRHRMWGMGLLAGTALIYFHGSYFLEMVNPFREPFAYSMLMSCFLLLLLFRQKRKPWAPILGGACFGIAIGAREPSALAAVSLLYVYVCMVAEDAAAFKWRMPVFFASGAFIGLIPFFLHNHMFSGRWWLPSYMVMKIDPILQDQGWNSDVIGLVLMLAVVAFYLVVIAVNWKGKGHTAGSDRPSRAVGRQGRAMALVATALTILAVFGFAILFKYGLIPGVNLARLEVGGPKTLNYLYVKAGWFGTFLFALGILHALHRRYLVFLAVYLPSFLLFLFFWSLYAYVKPRYVFTVELFIYPVMGVGLWGLLEYLAFLVPRAWNRDRLIAVLALVPVVALGVKLSIAALQGNVTLKVWHLGAIQSQLEAKLKEPLLFDSNRNHHSQLLSAIWGRRFSDAYSHNMTLFQPDFREHENLGLEAALKALSSRVSETIETKHVYSYGNSKRGFVTQWFDYEPVMDLGKTAYPLHIYDSVMDEGLFEIVAPSRTNIIVTHKSRGPGKYLVGLDLGRPWDDPQRTSCELYIENQLVNSRLLNHFQFVECMLDRPAGENVTVELRSDRPLVADPIRFLNRIDEPIRMPLGLRDTGWYRNHLSPSLVESGYIQPEGCILFDQGLISVPHFASPEQDVYVRFYHKYIQTGPFYEGLEHRLAVKSAEDARESLLEKSKNDYVTLYLGPGANRLRMKTVEFSSTMPTWKALVEQQRKKGYEGDAMIRLSRFKVWTVPNLLSAPYEIGVTHDFDAFYASGFYSPEHTIAGRFRWTKPEASIALPRCEPGFRPVLSVRTLEGRPEGHRHAPRFVLNGQEVLPQLRGDEDGNISYVFDQLAWRSDAKNELRILTPPYNPAKVLGVSDDRYLGIALMGVELN